MVKPGPTIRKIKTSEAALFSLRILFGVEKNICSKLHPFCTQQKAGRVSTQNAINFPTNATYLFLDPPTKIANQPKLESFLSL